MLEKKHQDPDCHSLTHETIMHNASWLACCVLLEFLGMCAYCSKDLQDLVHVQVAVSLVQASTLLHHGQRVLFGQCRPSANDARKQLQMHAVLVFADAVVILLAQ
jgi:hypothetical protein